MGDPHVTTFYGKEYTLLESDVNTTLYNVSGFEVVGYVTTNWVRELYFGDSVFVADNMCSVIGQEVEASHVFSDGDTILATLSCQNVYSKNSGWFFNTYITKTDIVPLPSDAGKGFKTLERQLDASGDCEQDPDQ